MKVKAPKTGQKRLLKRLADVQFTASNGTREQIMLATLKVIEQGGVDAVTHRLVADVAGVSLSSTTYHFASRQHLIRETFALYIDWIKRSLDEISKDVVIETVEEFTDFVVSVNERGYFLGGFVLAEYELTLFAARDNDIADLLHEFDNYGLTKFAGALERLGARSPFDAAHTVLHMLRGYELERLSYHEADSEDFSRRLRTVVQAYVVSPAVEPSTKRVKAD